MVDSADFEEISQIEFIGEIILLNLRNLQIRTVHIKTVVEGEKVLQAFSCLSPSSSRRSREKSPESTHFRVRSRTFLSLEAQEGDQA